MQPHRPSPGRVATPPQASTPLPSVLVVAGGKIGVGTSTIAAALATAFSTTSNTLLVDADEGANTLHTILGVSAPRTVDDLLRGAPADRVLTAAAPRLTLLAGRDPALPPLSSSQRAMLFQRFAQLYARFETVVVDAGARAASVLAACSAAPVQAFIVTTGDRIAAAGAYAMEKLLHLEFPEVPVDVIGNLQDDAESFATRELLHGATQQFLGRPLEYAGTVPADPALIALLGGRTPDAPAGDPHFSPALMAITEIGTRALAASGEPVLGSDSSPSTVRTPHGTR